jgi:hypothetical protein
LKTDLEDVAQNTHSSKSLQYFLCIPRTLCDTGPCRAIVQVFDSIHL